MTDEGRPIAIDGIPTGALIEVRAGKYPPGLKFVETAEQIVLPPGLYKVLGPDPDAPGYRQIETVVMRYRLTRGQEPQIVKVHRDPRDDARQEGDNDPDWYRKLIDPDDDGHEEA